MGTQLWPTKVFSGPASSRSSVRFTTWASRAWQLHSSHHITHKHTKDYKRYGTSCFSQTKERTKPKTTDAQSGKLHNLLETCRSSQEMTMHDTNGTSATSNHPSIMTKPHAVFCWLVRPQTPPQNLCHWSFPFNSLQRTPSYLSLYIISLSLYIYIYVIAICLNRIIITYNIYFRKGLLRLESCRAWYARCVRSSCWSKVPLRAAAAGSRRCPRLRSPFTWLQTAHPTCICIYI